MSSMRARSWLGQRRLRSSRRAQPHATDAFGDDAARRFVGHRWDAGVHGGDRRNAARSKNPRAV
jgi:hypothetical protein